MPAVAAGSASGGLSKHKPVVGGGKSISSGKSIGAYKSLNKKSKNSKQHPAFRVNKSSGGKSLSFAKPKPKKKFRPGTVALREIRRYQRDTSFIIKKAPLERIIKEILNENSSMTTFPNGVRIRLGTQYAIREALEQYVVNVLEDANLCCLQAKMITVRPKDVQLALRIRGERT